MSRNRTDLSEAFLNAAGSAISVIDSEGRVVCWNQAVATLTGISAEQIRGNIFHDTVLFPGDRNRWTRELDRISAGLAPRDFESRWKIHDGSLLSLGCSCSVVRGSAGKVQYIVCTVRDSLYRELMRDRSTELQNMSRLLHDTISQDLVALSFHVSYFETRALDQPAQSQLKSALALIDRCCRFVRAMSFMLAPPSPPENSLDTAIGQYTEYLREETGLAITTHIDPVSPALPPEAQSVLFLAVRKWIAQGIRTRKRPEISVRLTSRTTGTVLELGLVPPAGVSTGGWTLIRERTRALGGEFDIAADSNHITARMSFPERADSHETG